MDSARSPATPVNKNLEGYQRGTPASRQLPAAAGRAFGFEPVEVPAVCLPRVIVLPTDNRLPRIT